MSYCSEGLYNVSTILKLLIKAEIVKESGELLQKIGYETFISLDYQEEALSILGAISHASS